MESPTEDRFKPCAKNGSSCGQYFSEFWDEIGAPDWFSIYREFPANTRKILHDIEVKPLNEAPASAWLILALAKKPTRPCA
jgi:hypothetical protein